MEMNSVPKFDDVDLDTYGSVAPFSIIMMP